MLLFRYVLRSLKARTRANLLTMLAVALLVTSGALGLSFYQGLRDMLVDTTPPENVIVLAEGAASEAGSKVPLESARKVVLFEDVRRDGDAPVTVRELVTRMHLTEKAGEYGPVAFRGFDTQSATVHRITLASGTLPAAGSIDIALGRRAATEHGLKLGDEVPLPVGKAKVTGIFTARGAPAEDEAWTPRSSLEAMLNVKFSSSLTLVAQDAGKVDDLVEKINGTKGLGLRAVQLKKMRADDAQLGTVARVVLLLLILLGVVATFAIATTMNAATVVRMPELAALAALGVRRSVLGRIVLVESLLLGGFGAILGALLGWVIRSQMSLITLGSNPVELSSRATGPLIGLAIGLSVGLIGGILPAIMVRRLDIVREMR
ncbi:MAG: ABC transporter permease [Myxococcota bacterium]|nr:ABC transporter permease [Myxococcota bacterium]